MLRDGRVGDSFEVLLSWTTHLRLVYCSHHMVVAVERVPSNAALTWFTKARRLPAEEDSLAAVSTTVASSND